MLLATCIGKMKWTPLHVGIVVLALKAVTSHAFSTRNRFGTTTTAKTKTLPLATAPCCTLPTPRSNQLPLSLSSSDALTPPEGGAEEVFGHDGDEETADSSDTVDILQTTKPPTVSWRQRVRSAFSFSNNNNSNLTTKQRLAKMGLSALLSYGWISNLSYTVSMSVAWFVFSKQTGLSPLAKDQWKPFLAVYAGFWVVNNVLRPLRVAAAIAITPAFDRVIASIQNRTNVSRSVAIALVVFLLNIVGTTALLVSGVCVASLASGVPVFTGNI